MLRGTYGIEIESLISENRGLFLTQMFAFALNENLLFKALANLSDSSHIEWESKCATGRRACLANELLAYNVYYNEHRPHTAIGGMTPLEIYQVFPH